MIDKGISRVWLQHYDKEVSANLSYEHISMYEILARAAERHPERTVLIFNN